MLSVISLERLVAFATVNNAIRLFAVWLGYRLLLALYNISPFHPLYKFPGPRLAAASFLYEAWYDLIKVGRYSWEIQSMHQKYGTFAIVGGVKLTTLAKGDKGRL